MKVKNIMFSGFAAAILMGVVAEANAAPVAVASKGYVDSVAGKLVDLDGAADEATNLVEAINVKLDPVNVLEGQVADGEYFTAVKQETKGQVSVSKANLATSIDSTTLKAPTTKAVYEAIQGSRYDDTALAERVTANEEDITSLQNDKEDKSNKTDTINAQSTSTQYPSAAAVYSAVEDVRADIPNMPEACNERGVTCVLTSEGGNFAWAILTQPVTADDESLMAGTAAQDQDLSASLPTVQNP